MYAVSPAKRCPCCVVACLVCASASRCRCHALPRTLTWHGHSFLLTIARLACYNLTTPCIITLHTMPHRHFALGVTTGHLTSELVVSQDMIHANLLTYPSGCTIGFPLGTESPRRWAMHPCMTRCIKVPRSALQLTKVLVHVRSVCLSVLLSACLQDVLLSVFKCLAVCLVCPLTPSLCLSARSLSLALVPVRPP